MSDMTKRDHTWTNYHGIVYGKNVSEEWMRQNIILPAVEYDPNVAPWDNWRIIERNGGLQAQVGHPSRDES